MKTFLYCKKLHTMGCCCVVVIFRDWSGFLGWRGQKGDKNDGLCYRDGYLSIVGEGYKISKNSVVIKLLCKKKGLYKLRPF